MKQPKKLTREQKECLSAHYLNCKDWMLVEETGFVEEYGSYLYKRSW